MTKIVSDSLNRSMEIKRIIGHLKGEEEGPTVIFFGGIHGNENSGVFALHDVMESLQSSQKTIRGNIYAIAGNIAALERGVRYCTEDLNRIWNSERIDELMNGMPNESLEVKEQREIYFAIREILSTDSGPFYFMDLHTTSSETVPFAMVNDSLLNRKFTEQYPLPIILGIEEYLDGPLLSFINELGYVSFGYEAGSHDSISSYENQLAFIFISLVFCKSIERHEIEYNKYYEHLAKNTINSRDIYEIKYRYKVKHNSSFVMQPGYVNFQKVNKGQLLAINNEDKIYAAHTGRIFMPLYQNQGEEGFFEIAKIHKFFLNLSAVLRSVKFDRFLSWLPGIRWESQKHDELIVNLLIAKFFTKQFLHLLGYRSKRIDKNHLRVKNREAASRAEEYQKVNWL